MHEIDVQVHLDCRDEESANQPDAEKRHDRPQVAVGGDLQRIAIECAEAVARRAGEAARIPDIMVGRDDDHHGEPGGRDREGGAHVEEIGDDACRLRAAASRPVREEQGPGQRRPEDVGQHVEGGAGALDLGALLVVGADLKTQGGVRDAEDGIGGPIDKIDREDVGEEERALETPRHRPEEIEADGHHQAAGHDVRLAPSPARTRVVADVAHGRIDEGIPEGGGGEGDAGMGKRKPEGLRVIEHRKPVDAIEGEREGAFAAGVAHDMPEQRFRRARRILGVHGGQHQP